MENIFFLCLENNSRYINIRNFAKFQCQIHFVKFDTFCSFLYTIDIHVKYFQNTIIYFAGKFATSMILIWQMCVCTTVSHTALDNSGRTDVNTTVCAKMEEQVSTNAQRGTL